MILNPDSVYIESCYNQIASNQNYLDSIFKRTPNIKASVIENLSKGDLETKNLLYEKLTQTSAKKLRTNQQQKNTERV